MKRKQKNAYYLFVYYLSTKNNKSDFSQKCNNELLILFVYTPVVFGKSASLVSSVLKNIFITYSK